LSALRSETFYAEVRGKRRFCILHSPPGGREPRGSIVHVHALGEEMNKSRRMVSLAARALAASGWSVLLMDLDGCGDSCGEFRDASWEGWIEDAQFAQSWCTSRVQKPCWLWGLRAGCLIAEAASERNGGATPLLLWQPVLSGRLHLKQILRLKLANEALAQAQERQGTEALRTRLLNGSALEIAGYVFPPDVAAGLDRASITLKRQNAPVALLEIGTEGEAQLAAALASRLAELRSRDVKARTMAAPGPQFWQTVEIAEAPAFVAATVATLEGSASAAG
jgi:uncharacterized protein